jgi:putative transposase
VVEVLSGLIPERGVAAALRADASVRLDNGPEFTSRVLDQWAYWNGVVLDFTRPGKPTDNAIMEALNSRFRQECLKEH